MKKIALAALLTFATPAHADLILSEGEWFAEDGTRLLFDGLNFQIWTGEPEYWKYCRIVEWPLDTPVAKATCVNGDTHRVEINSDSVYLDGMELVQELEHGVMEGDGH